MDTLRQANEQLYYDLQQLTFTPDMTDEEYVWVDKVLTLGHPEDWPQGMSYTDYVASRTRKLFGCYLSEVTQELYDEWRQHNAPTFIQVDLCRGLCFPVIDGRWNWYGEGNNDS